MYLFQAYPRILHKNLLLLLPVIFTFLDIQALTPHAASAIANNNLVKLRQKDLFYTQVSF